ncbi:MAG: type I-C CRISPR-associated protein Cas7/Csd2 [Chloroflexi bacterium]|nr:type I-C CRISPR-associated protein Cas7/Csd2 [Chloroflexota bacterium]
MADKGTQSKDPSVTLANKVDFAVVFRVKNANPNGDPLNGNRPRTTYDGLGEVSDVCIKRKMRNRLMEMDKGIFVQSDDNRIDGFVNLRSRWESVIGSEKDVEALRQKACRTWFDVRAFGQVFPFKAATRKKSANAAETGTSDDKSTSFGIRGPVSIHPAFSLDRVEIMPSQITKCTSLEGNGIDRQPDQMGMKHRVDQGIYVFFGSMNPQLAQRTGFSEDDAQAIKQVLPRLFENDASSARPEGSMEVLKVVWWQHNCPNGQASSAKVHRSLQVSAKDGGTVDITFDGSNGPKPEVIDGY